VSTLFTKALFPGEVIADEWCIEEPLATGGFATVYAAYRMDDETPVVVKAPKEGAHLLDTVAYQRFEQEARAAMRLEHPNIVKVYGYGHHRNGVPYIVMEALEGEPLTDRILRGRMSVEDTTAVLRQMLEALGYMHRQGLVHRDLKPGNIYLSQPGGGLARPPFSIKLLDFGFVKPMEKMQGLQSELTVQGTCVGTPGYMAPEVYFQHPINPAVDVYGAGVVAYEMLIGGSAFEGAPYVRVMKQQKNRCTPPPSDLERHPLLRIVYRMMLANPAERYATCHDVLAALDDRRARRGFWSFWPFGGRRRR
jgi:serine/threonine-protein kinase